MEKLNIQTVTRQSVGYPSKLRERLGESAPETLYVLGSSEILRQPMVALICSVKCPGSVVIQTFDAIREMRDAGIVVIGGFLSPMEKECLDFLLRGKQPVVMSPSKGLERLRLSKNERKVIDEGRLTVVSIFPPATSTTNKQQSQTRNEFIAALATAILIPHASLNGCAESIARENAQQAQMLFTVENHENDALTQIGAQTYTIKSIHRVLYDIN